MRLPRKLWRAIKLAAVAAALLLLVEMAGLLRARWHGSRAMGRWRQLQRAEPLCAARHGSLLAALDAATRRWRGRDGGNATVLAPCPAAVLRRAAATEALVALPRNVTAAAVLARRALWGLTHTPESGAAGARARVVAHWGNEVLEYTREDPPDRDLGAVGVVRLVVFSRACTRAAAALERALARGGQRHVEVLGLGASEPRLERLLALARRVPPNDLLVVLSDGAAVVPACSDEQLRAAFRSFGAPIVFMADSECAPVPTLWWRYQRTPSWPRRVGPWAFLSARAFAARAWALRDALELAEAADSSLCADDQAFWSELYLSRIAHMPLTVDNPPGDDPPAHVRLLARMHPENHPLGQQHLHAARSATNPTRLAYRHTIYNRGFHPQPLIALDVASVLFQSVDLDSAPHLAAEPLDPEAARVPGAGDMPLNRWLGGRRNVSAAAGPLGGSLGDPLRVYNRLSGSYPCVLVDGHERGSGFHALVSELDSRH